MLTIRPARPEDLPALLRMVQALARHHDDTPTVTSADLQRDLFSATPWMTVLLADTPQGPVGYASLLPLAQMQAGTRGMDLHHLFVAPDERNSGVGSRLIEAALAHARAKGCTTLSVTTRPDNTAAQDFYARRGFSPRPGTSLRFTRPLAA